MVATRHVTIEEFAATSRDGQWELVDGEPTEVNPASFRSVWIASELYARIREFVRQNDLGRAVADGAGFILFEDRAVVRSPDVAFISRDRLTTIVEGFVPLAPDLAVEVLSPSDRRADVLAKIAMYLQAGVRLVWLIDPEPETVTVFAGDRPVSVIGPDGVLDGGDVLPGFSIAVTEIFAEE
jgi:Uma2 family endonuclease